MTLQAAIAAALPDLRVEAEARMTSTVTIHRRGIRDAQDEASGLEGDVWTSVATAVPFRLGGADRGGSGSRTLTIGGVETTVAVRVGSLPTTQTDLADGDLLEVTAGENSGVVLHVVEATWQDQATARRVPVFEVQRPPEWDA
jgi:hypothetical protein